MKDTLKIPDDTITNNSIIVHIQCKILLFYQIFIRKNRKIIMFT